MNIYNGVSVFLNQLFKLQHQIEPSHYYYYFNLNESKIMVIYKFSYHVISLANNNYTPKQ